MRRNLKKDASLAHPQSHSDASLDVVQFAKRKIHELIVLRNMFPQISFVSFYKL
jgi:hypothetical protein